MENTILKAKLLIADYFKINPIHFDKHTTRKKNIVEARRFLVYFLRNELGFTFHSILIAIPSITNHTTVIHHHKRMKEIMKLEKGIKQFYQKVVDEVIDNHENLIVREMVILKEEKKELTKKLKQLKKLL